jgi:FkbM family methyltransferase
MSYPEETKGARMARENRARCNSMTEEERRTAFNLAIAAVHPKMKILPNGIAVIEGDTHHAKWVQECGSLIHDPWFAEKITRHLKPGSVAVDGGANIGTLTRAMLDAGAKVLAFEPNSQAYECLVHNCPQAITFQAGLNCERGYAIMNRQDNAGASYLSVGGMGDAAVILRVLDEYELSQCDLIKLDIEGYELKALQGARVTIELFHPVLILEINRGALERAGDSPEAIFEFLEDKGYSWEIIQPDCKRYDPQYDIICLPK